MRTISELFLYRAATPFALSDYPGQCAHNLLEGLVIIMAEYVRLYKHTPLFVEYWECTYPIVIQTIISDMIKHVPGFYLEVFELLQTVRASDLLMDHAMYYCAVQKALGHRFA